jgi:MinD superfamily P-loop ATPase
VQEVPGLPQELEQEVSYRCQKCKTVCNHSQIKVVTERYDDRNIKKEQALCEDCAVEMKINVRSPAAFVPNGQGVLEAEGESKSVLVGSA